MSGFYAKRTTFGGTAGRAANRFTAADRKRLQRFTGVRAGAAASYQVALAQAALRSRAKARAGGWSGRQDELKVNEIPAANYAADVTGSITCLNAIAVGDDYTMRDGRQITMKSIHVNGLLAPIDNTTTPCLARLLIVLDTQPNSSAVPAMTDVLNAATSITFTNLNNRDRFKVLKDCKFALGMKSESTTAPPGVGAFSDGGNTYVVDEYLKLGDVKTTYSGIGGTVTSVATNSLLMVIVGNTGANSGGNFSVATRLRFTDK